MGVQSIFREESTMKILLYSCLLLATLGLSSGGILKKLKKLLKTEDECEVVWEEHYQPHCTTSYQKHCEHKYLDKCHTEYTTECKEGHERQCKTEYDTQCKTEYAKQCSNEYHEKCETEYIEQCNTEFTEECWDEPKTNCHSHPECHTTYVDHCEPVFKKQCRGGGKKKGKKFKRDVAKELVHSEEEDVDEDEDEDEDLEVIRKMSTAELLDIMAESGDEENSSNRSKEKRDIAAKIHKLFKKGKKEECETVRHGEHCEKVPVENCHDVEKCTKEIHRECKKIPHEKCWQEPHEKCWQVPH